MKRKGIIFFMKGEKLKSHQLFYPNPSLNLWMIAISPLPSPLFLNYCPTLQTLKLVTPTHAI